MALERGTRRGTKLVKNIAPGATSSAPACLQPFGGKLYFTADDATHGRELWRSGGRGGTTTLLKDINPGSGNAIQNCLKPIAGRLYFAATARTASSHGGAAAQGAARS